MTPSSHASLDDAFATLARRVAPGATLLGHRRLGGGVSAEVHALEVSARGVRRSFVVRCRVAAAWKPLPEDATATEFRLLEVLHDVGLRVPEPFLLDVSGKLLRSAALATLHEWRLPAEVEARRRERTSAFVARAADTLLRGG